MAGESKDFLSLVQLAMLRRYGAKDEQGVLKTVRATDVVREVESKFGISYQVAVEVHDTLINHSLIALDGGIPSFKLTSAGARRLAERTSAETS